MKKSFISCLIILIMIIFYQLYSTEKLGIIKEQFTPNEEKKNEIVKNFEAVQKRLEEGPIMHKNVEQYGLEIIDIKEIKNDKNNLLEFTIKSNETNVVYNKVNVKVELYDKKNQLINSLTKELKNFTPNHREKIRFDISKYDINYYKISYQTNGSYILKKK